MSFQNSSRSAVYLSLRGISAAVLTASVLFFVAGCGAKSTNANSARGDDGKQQTPATPAEAARTLDLSTIALAAGAKPSARHVASLSYVVTGGNVKAVFEFHKKALLAQGWKELANGSVTAQSASGMFSKNGFAVSLTTFPNGQGEILVSLQNHGNVRPGQLPVPDDGKPIYIGDASAMYVTESTVPTTADTVRGLLTAKGWIPYGGAGDSIWYKQNGVRANVTVSSAPAQGGKTMVSYTTELLSADIPAPPDATELRYADQTQELSFQTATEKPAILDFYRTALAPAKWEATLDHVVETDGADTMIFRNPAKDMLTLAFPRRGHGNLRVSIHYQTGAEIAELDRQIKAQKPALRAAAEAREKEAAARFAEANKPVPKITVPVPTDARDVEIKADEIKFTLAKGKGKSAAETLQKQLIAVGWHEDIVTLDAMAGALSFSKEKQSLTISYTDTDFTPAEVTISSASGELETAPASQ
ncbi:MAG: hypothetical protein ABI946_03875 [Chthoniobacterales bacterium]